MLDCDGIQEKGSGSVDPPSAITSAANNPAGGGGRGFRFWINDGQNVNSTPIGVNFTSAQSELYVRFYFRYALGFTWATLGYNKYWYFDNGQIIGWSQDECMVTLFGGHVVSWIDLTWDWLMQNGAAGNPRKSDGQWHWMEIHLKSGTQELWIGDPNTGVAVKSSIIGTETESAGWATGVHFPSNQNNPSNGGWVAFDWDDIAIQTTGPIGPLGGSTSLSPSGSPSDSPSSTLSPSSSKSLSLSPSRSKSMSQSQSSSPSPSPSGGYDYPRFVVHTSTNITDGEVSTHQLIPPGAKQYEDFQEGKIHDISNPANIIDLDSDKYTEIEWCLQATEYAEVDETYEFRVTKGE